MSYYIRDVNGQGYSDTVPNCNPLKYAGICTKSQTTFSSVTTGTPYLAIKDGTLPICNGTSMKSYNEAIQKMENNELSYSYHRCIFVGSYQSRSNEYILEWNDDDKKPYPKFQWINKTWNYKELYKGNEPVVSYFNKNYGNVLTWNLKDSRSLQNYYRPQDSNFGPHKADTTDKCLLGNNNNEWKGTYNEGGSYNDFNSDLTVSNVSNIKYFTTAPDNYNTLFGYSYKQITDENKDISYFTLNIEDIKNTGKNKLKIKYYWNVLFANKTYNGTSDILPELQSKFNSVSLDNHLFVTNYFASNNENWTPEENGKPYQKNVNLNSTVYYDNNTSKWKITATDVIKDANFYKFKNAASELDTWGEVETYKHFYVTWANNTSETTFENAESDYDKKVIVYGGTKKCIIPMGTLWCANLTGTPSPGEDYYCVAYDKDTSAKIYDRTNQKYVLAKAKKDILISDQFSMDDWDVLDENVYLAKNNKYNITTGWLSAQSEANWGPHSSVFLPYIDCYDNYCHWDKGHNGFTFTSYPPNGTLSNAYTMWNKNYGEIPTYEEIIASNTRTAYYDSYSPAGTPVYNPIIYNNKIYRNNLNAQIWYNVGTATVPTSLTMTEGYIYQDIDTNKFWVCTQEVGNVVLREFIAEHHIMPWASAGCEWFDGPYDASTIYAEDYKVDGTSVWNRVQEFTEFSTNKNYNTMDYVIHNGETYYAKIDIMSGYNMDSNPWNPYYYSTRNSTIQDYNVKWGLNTSSVNYIGNSEFTIDLTNVDKKYLHISAPATFLFNYPFGDSSETNPFITDFKMVYEAVD